MATPDDETPGADPLDFDADVGSGDDKQRKGTGFVPDFVRKAAVAGLGALFMTEEGVRNLTGQLKLPKEALQFILGQAERTKDEVSRVLTEEIRRFLQSERLREELLKLVSGMTVEIKADIRLVPDKEKQAQREAERAADEAAGGSTESKAERRSKQAEAPVTPQLVVREINARRGKRHRKE